MTLKNGTVSRRTRSLLLKLGVAGVAIVGASTLLAQPAEQPTSRPSRNGTGGGPGGFNGGGNGMGGDRPYGDGGRRNGNSGGGGGMGRWVDQPDPTADEWEDVVNFMQENSPVRLEMYKKLETDKGADSMLIKSVRKRAAWRYRELMGIRDHNSDLYEFAFKQFKLEDAVLATLAKIRRDGESPTLIEQRDKQVHDFVANSLDERKARLQKLRDMVTKEEATLAGDRADMSSLEDKQRDRFDREMKRMLDFAVDNDAPTTKPDVP